MVSTLPFLVLSRPRTVACLPFSSTSSPVGEVVDCELLTSSGADHFGGVAVACQKLFPRTPAPSPVVEVAGGGPFCMGGLVLSTVRCAFRSALQSPGVVSVQLSSRSALPVERFSSSLRGGARRSSLRPV